MFRNTMPRYEILSEDAMATLEASLPWRDRFDVVDIREHEYAIELLHAGFEHAGDLELPQFGCGCAIRGHGRDEQRHVVTPRESEAIRYKRSDNDPLGAGREIG